LRSGLGGHSSVTQRSAGAPVGRRARTQGRTGSVGRDARGLQSPAHIAAHDDMPIQVVDDLPEFSTVTLAILREDDFLQESGGSNKSAGPVGQPGGMPQLERPRSGPLVDALTVETTAIGRQRRRPSEPGPLISSALPTPACPGHFLRASRRNRYYDWPWPMSPTCVQRARSNQNRSATCWRSVGAWPRAVG